MIHTLTFSNFRGARVEVTIPLRPLTVLVGPHGSGKSTVLEALSLATVRNPEIPLCDLEESYGDWIFPAGDTTLVARMRASVAGYRFAREIRRVPQRRVSILDEGEERDRSKVLRAMRFLPNLRGAAVHARLTTALRAALVYPTLTVTDDPQPMVNFGDAVIPLARLGGAARGVANVVSWLAQEHYDLVIDDDFGDGLNAEGAQVVADSVWEAVRRGTQVVLSTHNTEAINALIGRAGADVMPLAFVRVRMMARGELVHSVISGEDARAERWVQRSDLR